MGKPYLPLMMGDWLKGTRGMRADVKGVYIGLLIHQYDHGHIPSDLETLALIEPEVGKVWDTLKEKFEQVAPGKLQNVKLEEVRAFWSKQGINAKKGGRPTKRNPKPIPNAIPNKFPNPIPHNDCDLDLELRLKGALDEIYIDQLKPKWKHIDFDVELQSFQDKVRGSPDHYAEHDTGGIRLAFQSQLRNAKQNARTNNQRSTPGAVARFSGTGYDEPL